MQQIYDLMSDVMDGGVSIVKSQAHKVHGEYVFRGRNYSDWYVTAAEAFDSWEDGTRWGRLFEEVAEVLEEMELSIAPEEIEYGTDYI